MKRTNTLPLAAPALALAAALIAPMPAALNAISPIASANAATNPCGPAARRPGGQEVYELLRAGTEEIIQPLRPSWQECHQPLRAGQVRPRPYSPN